MPGMAQSSKQLTQREKKQKTVDVHPKRPSTDNAFCISAWCFVLSLPLSTQFSLHQRHCLAPKTGGLACGMCVCDIMCEVMRVTHVWRHIERKPSPEPSMEWLPLSYWGGASHWTALCSAWWWVFSAPLKRPSPVPAGFKGTQDTSAAKSWCTCSGLSAFAPISSSICSWCRDTALLPTLKRA